LEETGAIDLLADFFPVRKEEIPVSFGTGIFFGNHGIHPMDFMVI